MVNNVLSLRADNLHPWRVFIVCQISKEVKEIPLLAVRLEESP